MNPRISLAQARRMRGVTLIEVLVTMVIVAVGLLGLAGMQVRGLSIQKDAHGRALASYQFATAFAGTYTAPGVDCLAAVCTATQQAQYDFDQWFARVRGGALPGGWANIVPALGSANAWDVTLMWVETGFRTNGTLRTALGSSCPAALVLPQEVECVTVRVWP